MAFSFGKMNDPDATLFIQVSEITGSTQRGAIVDLVKDLKSNGLWSKMKAIYPFVGGTASTHKWNLKDPRDLDAAFRLSFVGGWTHSSTGATGNATNAYADTYLIPKTTLTNTSLHLSFYSRTQSNTNVSCEIGVSQQDPFPNDYVQIRVAGNYAAGDINTLITYTTTTDASGYWIASNRSSTDRKIWRNNSSEANSTISNTSALTNYKLYLGARANVASGVYTPVIYSDKECAFATIGDGLTDSEVSTLYTIVQKYQTTLGRQV
jgi:hypothetical protein